MFTDLYLETTNPNLTLKQFFSASLVSKMGGSVIFHTIMYSASINLFYFIFSGKCLSSLINTRILLFLLIVMSVGFLGRFYHVKEIYKAYKELGYKELGYKDQNTKYLDAKEYVDKTYITWYFLS